MKQSTANGARSAQMDDALIEDGPPRSASFRVLAILMGPVLGVSAYLLLPAEYHSQSGQAVAITDAVRCTLGVMVWMACWWLTQCVPLAATSLLPMLIFPAWGVQDFFGTLSAYCDPMIRLFFGGFLLSEAIARWGLGERLSLWILSLVGTRPAQVVGGLMFVTAAISAFVSNSATAAMMLPIALSVTHLMREQLKEDSAELQKNFATCSMLGVGYAASLGGLMTIIGTPPNVFVVGYLSKSTDAAQRLEITFFQWTGVGVPLACILLPICWWLLTKWLFPVGTRELIGARELVHDRYSALGPMKAGEWATAAAFGLAAVLWVSNSFLSNWTFAWNGTSVRPFDWLNDWVVAVLAAGMLFLWPVSTHRWQTALMPRDMLRIPWSVLILFGGGLALSSAMSASGTDRFLAARITLISAWPIWLVVAASVALVVFFSEIASNLATAATLVPIFSAMSAAWGVHPAYMAVAVTLAASCGFMLPVATPPNAIVFSSGLIRQRDMLRAGWALDWICIVVISLISWTLVGWFLI